MVGGAVAVGVVLSGCVIGTPDSDGSGEPSTPSQISAQDRDPSGTPDPTRSPGLDGSSGGAEAEVGVPYSLAYLDNGVVKTSGTLESALAEPGPVAWSTSKVPLALAAARAAEDGTSTLTPAEARRTMTSAITVSDNAAAQRLWDSLGDPATAGAKVDAVLRDGGDHSTRTQTTVTRPGFTSFGQTSWTVEDQVRFAGQLSCLAGAEPVMRAMGQITVEQSYGLGSIGGAQFKGGWGPDLAGAYQVRQFGVIPGAEGTLVPVAIEVTAPDGSYGSGIAALDEIVDQLGGVFATSRGVDATTCRI